MGVRKAIHNSIPMPEVGQPADRQPYSTFVVELLFDEYRRVRRTRVTHVQTGAEDRWAGWDEERLLQFMAMHGGLSLPE